MPAARALAVRARDVRLRAGRVVCFCSARLDRADSARQRRRHRGPPTGNRGDSSWTLGSPALPRIVPVDEAACRACRDLGGRNHS